MTEFEVTEGGTLRVAGYREAQSRAEFYEDAASYWFNSPQDLSEAMNDCQPLAWAVQSIYSDHRESIAEDLMQARRSGPRQERRLAALIGRLNTLPVEPEYGAQDWLLGLSKNEFESSIVPLIERWFNSPPNRNYEADHLPLLGTAQGAALDFFQRLNDELLDRLGIQIILGDRPGSTYLAAELTRDVCDANEIAIANELSIRFIRMFGSDSNEIHADLSATTQREIDDLDRATLKSILECEVSGGAFREQHVLPGGSKVEHTLSQATGLHALQAVNDYRHTFGELPEWVIVCHPTHRIRLCEWALKSRLPLPLSPP